MLRPFGRFCIDVRGVPAWYRAAIGVAPVEAETSSWSFSLRLLGAALRRRIGGDAGQVYLILNPGGFQGGLTLFGAARLTAIVAAFAVLRVIGVRICRFGASIGPFAPLRARLEACKTWFMYAPTVRDSLSLAYATSIGMRGVRYFPDLAFAMHPVIANTTDRELPARYVVFSFREIRAAHRRTALLSWLDALCVRLREGRIGRGSGQPGRFRHRVQRSAGRALPGPGPGTPPRRNSLGGGDPWHLPRRSLCREQPASRAAVRACPPRPGLCARRE